MSWGGDRGGGGGGGGGGSSVRIDVPNSFIGRIIGECNGEHDNFCKMAADENVLSHVRCDISIFHFIYITFGFK